MTRPTGVWQQSAAAAAATAEDTSDMMVVNGDRNGNELGAVHDWR